MAEPIRSTRIQRGVVHFRADAADWLLRGELFTAPPPEEGRTVFHESAGRRNARYDHGPRGTPAYEKESRRLTLSDLLKTWMRAGHPTWPLRHEWDMLWRARAAGVRVPEPIAAGMRRGALFPRTDFLLTEELVGRSVADELDALVDGPMAARRAAAVAIGRAVADLHAAGIAFPDLYAKHVILEKTDGGWSVGFLDLASAYAAPRPTPLERARDLGAIAGSLPFRVPAKLLLLGLRAYVDRFGGGWTLHDAWNACDAAARNVLRLRRFRSGLAPRPGAAIAATPRERALLHRFLVPVAGPDAPFQALDDASADLFRDLVFATFQAGLLPTGPLLSHLRAHPGGGVAWSQAAPLSAPRKARLLHARWRAAALGREVRRSNLTPAASRAVVEWIRGPAVEAFALSAKRL
jgi:hypothetical protein